MTTNNNTIENDKNTLSKLIAEIRKTYNTDPRYAVLEAQIKNLRTAIANQEAWVSAR